MLVMHIRRQEFGGIQQWPVDTLSHHPCLPSSDPNASSLITHSQDSELHVLLL
jgi:hypothetical protein